MTVWVVPAGLDYEWERESLDERAVYLDDDQVPDLGSFDSEDELGAFLTDLWPDLSPQQVASHRSQWWAYSYIIGRGDNCGEADWDSTDADWVVGRDAVEGARDPYRSGGGRGEASSIGLPRTGRGVVPV